MMNELAKRNIIVAKAREKYIPSQTMNISEALEFYLKNDALKEEQVPAIINKVNKPKTVADQIGRPNCPECSQPLGLRIINTPCSKANIYGWKTCWECLSCGYEKYSKESVKELIKKTKDSSIFRTEREGD